MPGPIQITTLKIQGQRTPYSERFDDVYFAPESGIDESRHVYLDGIRLRERLASPATTIHTVGEIGFGVGLNFLLTLREFQAHSRPEQKLYYFSAEQYPVRLDDLSELYSLYPELAAESAELLAKYPVLTPGIHALRFLGGRVTLYLMLGPAQDMFQQIDTPVESWYWDGFAPLKNPDAFSEQLFQVVASKSASGAVGASFTSAGWVRRGLEAAGFEIEKRGGFGRKRECIRGVFKRETMPSALPAWYSAQKLKLARAGERIAVAGAGFAGSAIARKLADRGFAVTVFDPNGIAARASGNKAGLFNVQISRLPNPISRFAQASLVHFLNELKQFDLKTHLGITRADTQDFQALQNSQYPADFFSLQADGIHLPRCGFLNPVELCRARLRHPNIELRQERWGAELRREFDHVVYAIGADLKLESPPEHPLLSLFPVRPIRGQLLELAATDETRRVRDTRVHHAYVTPLDPAVTGAEVHLLGATYQAKNILPDQASVDREFLLAEARRSWPEFAEISARQVVGERVGYRLSTPDKLPLIGPLVDPAWLRQNYGRALKGAKIDSLPPLEVSAGEWCLLGLGSRGITFSSLGSEILASLMTGEPLPIELDLWEHLHSARFFIRNLRKNTVD